MNNSDVKAGDGAAAGTAREKLFVYELIAQAVCDAALKAEKKQIDIKVFCEEVLTAYYRENA